MFNKKSSSGYREIVPGILMKTLVCGEKTHMIETNLKKGNAHELHNHPHEQTGYLVSGRLRLTVEDKSYEVQPGDSWSIPGGIQHGTEIIEDSVVVEVFSPVRDEYL
jgi:quercetin dioxygenase-like cupin family protein